MSTNDEIRDAAIRHAVHNARYGRGLAAKIVKLLNAADQDLMGTIAQRAVKITERGFDTGPATTKRLAEMFNALRLVNNEVYKKLAKELKIELEGFAQVEADHHAGVLGKAITVDYRAKVPSPTYLKTLVENTPIDGHLLASWTNAMSANRLGRVEQAIRVGLVQGETIDQLVRRIRGTKAQGYTDGVLAISRRSAETLAITSVSTVANATRLAVYQENTDVIKGVTFNATLDSRTSPQCQKHDGEFFALDAAHPKPPLHPRCRSVLIGVTKSWEELNIPRKEASEGTRASMNGQVPANTTYGDWLKNQPESIQNDVLGAERAKLFREGKVAFKDLYRDNGSYRSLDELRERANTPKPTAPKPKKPAPTPKPEPTRFTSPINPDVNDATIKVMKRTQAAKAITPSVQEGARNPAYPTVSEFRNTQPSQLGKVSFPTSLSDEAASMIAAIHPELDAMSAAFGIPKLRGYKSVKSRKAAASMGDGLMSLSAAEFNSYALGIGGKIDDAAEALQKTAETIREEMLAISKEITRVREARRAATSLDTSANFAADEHILIKQYNAKVRDLNKASKAAFKAKRATVGPSEWKVGDEVKDRPFVSTAYFTGIDKARSVLFHEFGHHVHQMFKKEGHRRAVGPPPIEIELSQIFRKKLWGIDSEVRKARDLQPSKYSLEDAYEWFAENFSLYMMGRKDLVDKDVEKLIERLLDESV